MPGREQPVPADMDALYERYGKPLEPAHKGEYVAITPDGRTVLGATILDVMQQAKAAFGPGSFIFKVGEQAVGKWR